MYFTTSRVLQKKEERSQEVSKAISKVKTIAIIALSIYAIFVSGYSFNLSKAYGDIADQKLGVENELQEVTTEYETLTVEYDSMTDKYKTISDSLVALTDTIEELEEINESLVESNNVYYEELQKFSEREELFDKYEYAIYTHDNQRTDITYDRLKTAESLCEEKGVDIDYLLSTIMVESGGNEKAKNKLSSATGFGQLVRGTGTYVYETVMGNGKGTYNHSLALDGDTNIAMTIEYIGYLQDRNPNMYEVCQDYRGVKDNTYVNKIDNYLRLKGKSLYTMN